MRIKIDPSITRDVCRILENNLAECYVQDEGIIGTDEYDVSIIESMKIRYEIIIGHEIKAEDIAKMFYK